METVSPVVPVAYVCWPVDGAPQLPWAVYTDEPDVTGADDGNWAIGHRWTVSLYERESDSSLEQELFDALSARYGYVEPQQGTWLESEGCYVCSFRFSEIERIG